MPINVTEIEEPKNKTCEDIWNLIAASVFYEYYAIKISFLLQSNTPVSEDASRCWMHNPHYKVNTEESCYFFERFLTTQCKLMKTLFEEGWKETILAAQILCTLCLGEEFCRVFSRLIIIAGNIRPLFYLQLPFTDFTRDIGAINLPSNNSELQIQIPNMSQTDNQQTK